MDRNPTVQATTVTTGRTTKRPTRPADATTPRMRAAALIGIAGQVAILLGSSIASWFQDDRYSIARHEMSDMAATGVPHAWFVQLYSGICGATTIIFAWAALRPALTGIRGRTQAAVLLTITFGAGFLSDAFFRIDCRTADGCTAEQKIQTWHAVIHASSAMLLLPLLVTPFLVARCLRRSPRWAPLARPSVWFGVALDVVILAMLFVGDQWGTGYLQRLFLLLGAAWIILLAAWILRLAVAANGPAHDGAPDRTRD